MAHRPVLLLLEGANDVEFLRRISRILHAADERLPDLGSLEDSGHLVVLPVGGSGFSGWTQRLAGLCLPEVHLYDREAPPETARRLAAVHEINERPGCRAFLTRKRGLENYLHPRAIAAAEGILVSFGEQDDVAAIVARAVYQSRHGRDDWPLLSARARQRGRERAKRWLNTRAVDCMTPELLAESDPWREIPMWLRVIQELGGP